MRLNFFVDDMLEYDGEKLNPILTKDTKAEELSNLILTRFVFDKLDQIKIVVGNEGDLKTAFVPEEELNSIIKEYIAIDKVNYNDTGIIYKGVRDLGFEYDFLLFKYDSLKKGFVHNYEYRSERKNLFSFYGQNADGSYCRTLTSIHLLPHPKGRTEFIVERDHIKLNIKAVIFCSYTKNNVTYEDLYADNSRKTPLVSYSYYEDPNVKKNKTFEESLAEQKRFTLFLDNGLSQVKPYTFIFNKDLRLTSVNFPK